MNELRFVAACLEGEGRSFPTMDSVKNSFADERKAAERRFREMLESCPKELKLEFEDSVLRLVTAWSDESFERGFVAGMRLSAQIFV